MYVVRYHTSWFNFIFVYHPAKQVTASSDSIHVNHTKTGYNQFFLLRCQIKISASLIKKMAINDKTREMSYIKEQET